MEEETITLRNGKTITRTPTKFTNASKSNISTSTNTTTPTTSSGLRNSSNSSPKDLKSSTSNSSSNRAQETTTTPQKTVSSSSSHSNTPTLPKDTFSQELTSSYLNNNNNNNNQNQNNNTNVDKKREESNFELSTLLQIFLWTEFTISVFFGVLLIHSPEKLFARLPTVNKYLAPIVINYIKNPKNETLTASSSLSFNPDLVFSLNIIGIALLLIGALIFIISRAGFRNERSTVFYGLLLLIIFDSATTYFSVQAIVSSSKYYFLFPTTVLSAFSVVIYAYNYVTLQEN